MPIATVTLSDWHGTEERAPTCPMRVTDDEGTGPTRPFRIDTCSVSGVLLLIGFPIVLETILVSW
jgi:hypothetical protein